MNKLYFILLLCVAKLSLAQDIMSEVDNAFSNRDIEALGKLFKNENTINLNGKHDAVVSYVDEQLKISLDERAMSGGRVLNFYLNKINVDHMVELLKAQYGYDLVGDDQSKIMNYISTENLDEKFRGAFYIGNNAGSKVDMILLVIPGKTNTEVGVVQEMYRSSTVIQK